jgi:PAS domain S-box-containing protein
MFPTRENTDRAKIATQKNHDQYAILPFSELENKIANKLDAVQKQLNEYAKPGPCQTNVGVWELNLQTGEVSYNEDWYAMLGYAKEDLGEPSNAWQGLLHPEDFERSVTALQNFAEGELETYVVKFRLRHKNGGYKQILSKGRMLRDTKGKPYLIRGCHTDITERTMAEDALLRSEQKYRNLFENSLVAMLRADAKTGHIVEANGKAWELLGVTPDSVYHLDAFFINKEERARIVHSVKDEGVVENQELQLKSANQELLWVSVSACYYPKDNLIECVLKDVTETRKTLLELQKVNFELDNFVYHASHDLRSPLRSILGLINILRIEQSEKAKENCVDMIEGSIKRLDNLVQDLLSMSRNNRINDPHVEINFMNEINYSFTNFYHVSDARNIDLRLNVRQPWAFVSDVTRVRIILNNLISNAFKYRSYERDQSFIRIDVNVTDKEAVFIIEDNGEGIPAEKLPNIFDMFVRASESSEGSGLGLYIVKNVIEKLKGEVKLESELDVGTKFTVTIPNTISQEE